MGDAMKIRKADSDDAAEIAKVAWQSFDEAFSGHPANDPADMKAYMDVAFTEETIRGELEDAANTYFAAEIEGRIVGYAKITDRATEEGVVAEKPIELSRLYCLDEFIGRGIGKSLMEACLAFASSNGNDVIWLGVWEFNERAQKFYGQWGFERCGDHVFVLGKDPQTDWLMSRRV